MKYESYRNKGWILFCVFVLNGHKVTRSTRQAKLNPSRTERSVTSRYHGSKFQDHMYNNGEFLQRWRRAAKKKTVGLDWQKTQLCKCITLFCTFQSRCCTTATWNFGVARWAQPKNFLFLNSPTFDKLNEIKLDRWSLKQCESPFKWCFGLLSSTNFAAMATWRNDFSSLLKNGQGHVLFRSLLLRRSAK